MNLLRHLVLLHGRGIRPLPKRDSTTQKYASNGTQTHDLSILAVKTHASDRAATVINEIRLKTQI
jgi:hypothetical protein